MKFFWEVYLLCCNYIRNILAENAIYISLPRVVMMLIASPLLLHANYLLWIMRITVMRRIMPLVKNF